VFTFSASFLTFLSLFTFLSVFTFLKFTFLQACLFSCKSVFYLSCKVCLLFHNLFFLPVCLFYCKSAFFYFFYASFISFMQVCFPFTKCVYFSFQCVYFHTRVSLISFLQSYFILCFDFFPASVIYFMQAWCVWFAQICFKYVFHFLGSCD
jgi:hypothetical protein